MDTDVIIKANSHGIRIIFHNDDPLEQLLVDIKEKLQHQNAFLKKEGKISVNTPIAQGLLGKKVGDVAEIKVPQGMVNLEVVNISF